MEGTCQGRNVAILTVRSDWNGRDISLEGADPCERSMRVRSQVGFRGIRFIIYSN